MRVLSGAGEFELEVREITIDGDNVVLVGPMGVWDASTTIRPEELVHLLRLSLNRKLFLHLARLPWLLRRRRRGGGRAASARG